MDDGDWPFYNSSLSHQHDNLNSPKDQSSSQSRNSLGHGGSQNVKSGSSWGSETLNVDRQEGILLGGSPEFVGVSLNKVHNDFSEG